MGITTDAKRGFLSPGLLRLPTTASTRELVSKLLDQDLRKHHCFWGRVGYHNHLPHHLLALYDLGAPKEVLQQCYDREVAELDPINLVDRATKAVGDVELTITRENWTEHLGPEKNYIAYLPFFEKELERLGASECLDEYIFSPKANGNGNNMLLRMVGAAVHPIIQIGYGIEFNSAPILASGLAETCVTRPMSPETYSEEENPNNKKTSFLEIIRDLYESETLKPVMPYDNDALLGKRLEDALKDGRANAIRELACKWSISKDITDEEIEERVEQAIWGATLVLAGTGKRGRKPRMDFFLMHLLTSSMFLPSITRAIKKNEDKARVLRVYVSAFLLIMMIRGRPRIDGELLMSYPEVPLPPTLTKQGTVREEKVSNPWFAIVHSSFHAPDSHVPKSIRALYFAAREYGQTEAGKVRGAIGADGKEVLPGLSKVDGTIFVRTAGVLIDAMGWTGHGEDEKEWDRSALGWDDAWKNEDSTPSKY